ncbi:MAG: glycosyltransferase family 4 protein [Acidobacteriota bacterium]
MTSDRVVVIGDPHSVFVQAPVRYWRGMGVDAVILTARWNGPSTVGDGLPVFAAEILASVDTRRAADSLVPFLSVVNANSLAQDPDRVSRALHTWGHTASPPTVTAPVYDALLIAAAVDVLAPVCVFGHEAFAYGLATSLCRVPRRTLFAWGADVLHYAAMSDVAHALVHQALHSVRFVLTNSASMEDALHERFDLPRDHIALISYGVDRERFQPAVGESRARMRAAYGIAPLAHVVMNIRRFRPHWGSTVAWRAMLAAACRRPDVHLVLLGGSGSEADVAVALEEAQAHGVSGRVTAMGGDVPLDTVAELMAVADVSLSMVDSLEPVSWSVLQAAACGHTVLVGEQPSYRAECARGLAIHLTDPHDAEGATDAVLACLDDADLRARTSAANGDYLAAYHDQHDQMTRLLRIVAGRETAERLLHAGSQRGAPAAREAAAAR